ncbi:MAG: substrate-binding domain-containing protein [Anaerolineales bacterium]|nr:substrate-binding domain-containing protein [Anaerolineales bacterium]
MGKSAWVITIVILLCMISACAVFNPLNVRDPNLPQSDEEMTRQDMEIATANYPRLDGSSSTFPLSMLIGCHFLQIPCVWNDWLDGTRLMLPEVTDYQGAFPEINHHGTHGSYENLINREADLILVARLPSIDELNLARLRGVQLEAVPIALDAFVFVLNTENPVVNLGMEEIRRIYTGELTNWKELGGYDAPIQPYRRNDNSGSEELMRELVMQGQTTIELPENLITSMVALIDQVSLDPNGIGYSVYYYEQFIAPKENLKLMGVDGVVPSGETIRTRSYPYTTEVYAVIREDLDKGSSAYKLRDWLLTDEGQAVVEESGYVSLK